MLIFKALHILSMFSVVMMDWRGVSVRLRHCAT